MALKNWRILWIVVRVPVGVLQKISRLFSVRLVGYTQVTPQASILELDDLIGGLAEMLFDDQDVRILIFFPSILQ